jgi:tetratricopeptide (TPR) repeat protein
VKARTTALLLTAAVVAYFVLLAQRALLLIGLGTFVGITLGVAVLLLPLVGLWIAWQNLSFGIRTEKMAKQLDREGDLPDVSDLPRRPSGRIQRDAADEYFEKVRVEAGERPDDWRGWFKLAHAYDVAGDRRRARETMKRALEIYDKRSATSQ